MIETDVLIALASRSDKQHEIVRKLLEELMATRSERLTLSPYSLTELDLLIASQSLKVKLPDFYVALKAALSYYGITALTPSPRHFGRAWVFRRKYGLTFFDSLHAATAVEEDEILVSFDRRYNSIKELKYKHPSSLV